MPHSDWLYISGEEKFLMFKKLHIQNTFGLSVKQNKTNTEKTLFHTHQALHLSLICNAELKVKIARSKNLNKTDRIRVIVQQG